MSDDFNEASAPDDGSALELTDDEQALLSQMPELSDVGQTRRINGPSAVSSTPCGTSISSTMMVMMIARTPSLNASIRDLLITPLRRLFY